MKQNVLLMHGGGPSAVINASLYGAIAEAKQHDCVGRVYGAYGGASGLLAGKLIDLTELGPEKMELLLHSPASAIGTSRDPLESEHYEAMRRQLQKFGVGWALLNGGNGTMDTCGKLAKCCAGDGVRVMGIPKTVDNDIAVTDHSPGYGSVARYMAGAVAGLCADVHSMPIHVSVLEAMGRNAGWVTAASALAAGPYIQGPDLILPPEIPFEEERFLDSVAQLLRRKRGVVVVASEGLHYADGSPIVSPVFQTGRATYFGDVGAHLAQLVTEKLHYKSRSEKPGLLARSSIAFQSPVDREEAIAVGRAATRAAIAGETGQMAALRRTSEAPYQSETFLTPIERVMLEERKMPAEFIGADGQSVTDAFVRWCRPLAGDGLPVYLSLK